MVIRLKWNSIGYRRCFENKGFIDLEESAVTRPRVEPFEQSEPLEPGSRSNFKIAGFLKVRATPRHLHFRPPPSGKSRIQRRRSILNRARTLPRNHCSRILARFARQSAKVSPDTVPYIINKRAAKLFDAVPGMLRCSLAHIHRRGAERG